MNALVRRVSIWVLCICTVAAPRARAADSSSRASGGVAALDFTLNDHTGAKRSLAQWKDRDVLVVIQESC